MKLTNERLRALNVTWQKMEPDTTIAAAFAELVARRDDDLTLEEVEALRGCSVHCQNAHQLALATRAIDKIIARGGV